MDEPTTTMMIAAARLGLSAADISRFLSKIDMSARPCWLWTGPTNGVGYGQFDYNGRPPKRKRLYAHRAAYELWIGPIPEGMTIDHLVCSNGRGGCVTPAHLAVATHIANSVRNASPPALNAAKTHCVHGHLLSGDNVYSPPDQPNKRHCRTCRAGGYPTASAEYKRKWAEAKRRAEGIQPRRRS